MNITLLENHWYDATFSPSARFGTGREDDGEAGKTGQGTTEADDTRQSDGGRGVRAALGALLAVAGTAGGVLAARRIRAYRAEREASRRQIEIDAIEYANDIAR